MKNCALCLQAKPLRRSHILPEFVYKPTYDEKHSHIYFDADDERKAIRHSGLWDELFCDECETLFNRWETYFAEVWFHHPLRPSAIPNGQITIQGLDYPRFKLFHLSILWRAGVATFDAFKQIRLGSHRDRIRSMLLSGQPGSPERYPFCGVALRDPENSGFKDSIISLPGAARIDGHTVYRTIFGGVVWYVAVSSHATNCPIRPTMTLDGTLLLECKDWMKHQAIRELADQLQRIDGFDSSAA